MTRSANTIVTDMIDSYFCQLAFSLFLLIIWHLQDVSEYLGIDLTNPNFNKTEISLRHLLTHTSSVVDRLSVLWSMYFVECEIITLKDFILDVFAQDGKYRNDSLNFANWRPGTK